GLIPDAKEATGSGLDTIDNTRDYLDKAEDRLNEMAPTIKKDLEKIQKISGDVNDVMDDTDSLDIDFSKGKEISNNVHKKTKDAIDRVDSVQSVLEQLKEQNQALLDEENADESDQAEDPDQD